jgi:hypothetical protein
LAYYIPPDEIEKFGDQWGWRSLGLSPPSVPTNVSPVTPKSPPPPFDTMAYPDHRLPTLEEVEAYLRESFATDA